MACVAAVGIGLIGSVGVRIAERYLSDLDAITREYIQGQITLEVAAEHIQQNLSLNLVLTAGKLIPDVLLVSSIGCWIYQLVGSIGSTLAHITDVNESKGFLDLLNKVRTVILRCFTEAQSFGLDLSFISGLLGIGVEVCPNIDGNEFIPAEIAEREFKLCISRLTEVGTILISILGWIVHMVCKTGSFFWTEIMKYFLVAWTAFHAGMRKLNMLTNKVRNYFRRLEPRVTQEDVADLNHRINNNIERHIDNQAEIPPEDNLMPDIGALSSLRDQLESKNNEIKVMENRNIELATQLQNREAQLNQIRMPDFVDLPLTLEQINSGGTIEIRRQSVDIPPGCRLGTQINVFEEENHGDHANKLPSFVVRIQEVPHQSFQRENQDLIYTATVDLSFIYPRPGRTLEIPSISSEKNHVLEIDEHTVIGNGTRFTIPSAGLPNPNDATQRGSIIINLIMRIPTREELLVMAAQLSNQ